MSEVKVNKISPRTNCGTVTVGDSGDSVSVTAGVPVTVNGDLKSNALKAVDGGSIISQCGTNITLGASGDTINLAAGASQTGFGRTGTVDWDTTAKTASFTAVSGNGYFVNTTSGAVTMTLPASPSAGDIVSVKDYAYTFETNNLTVNRNGSPIGGGSDTDTIAYSTNGDFLTFIYVDATQGWVLTNDSTNTDSLGAEYITETGGTIVCCGDFKTHIFTSPGTFCVSAVGNPAGSDTVEYLVVAGGGGSGGYGTAGPKIQGGGGGGGGGWRSFTAHPGAAPTNGPAALPISVQGYPITVGAGGAGDPANSSGGSRGANSIFSTIISTGGGGGGSKNSSSPAAGANKPGGSGGGGAGKVTPQSVDQGGTGNTPPVSPSQGEPGGNGARRAASPACESGAGGGGGASGAGNTAPTCSIPGKGGGTGQYVPDAFIGPTAPSYGCSPAPQAPNGRLFAGGGGGGSGGPGTGGDAGPGGGGRGGDNGTSNANGVVNTGGGAGGPRDQTSKSGGSGIVMVRYKYQN